MMLRHLVCCVALLVVMSSSAVAGLRAGAAVADVTPTKYPVLVNGGMLSKSAEQASTPINARAIVLADDQEQIGIVVVDSCMISREVLDEAKHLAAQKTGLQPDRILISATHAHTAPSSMGALGTDADLEYLPVLRAGIAEALAAAQANLEPAQVGWAVQAAPEFTAVRRWIRRPDRIGTDPFGNPTVRATMHAGRVWDDAIGETGPEDPDLSLLSIQSLDGRPIAVLANFSMHYFSGVTPLDADYFGRFCAELAAQVAPAGTATPQAAAETKATTPPFVGIMSHGCSGDIWRRDYTQPAESQLPHSDVDVFAKELAAIASQVYETISYDKDADLAMAESRMTLNYRVPDLQRLEWSRKIVEAMGDRIPKTTEEVYAREQILLHERQSTEIVLQAIRIGSFAIATTPNETYALTGLKLKRQSPLPQTMVIELANGGDGYIPPPEQHLLGGYNTWAARSAGLEVQAEPKIVATSLGLLEQVAGDTRRTVQQSLGTLAASTLQLKPLAYWRLDEMSGPWARDASGNHHDAIYELPVAFFLAGPRSELFCLDGETNRSVHIVDGRIEAPPLDLGDQYTISLWCWNGMPVDARETTGWMVSHGHPAGLGNESLGLGGTATQPGRLVLRCGEEEIVGATTLERWTWNHIILVRDGQQRRVYLNGGSDPEIVCAAATAVSGPLVFGSRGERASNWEGRLDEIALFDRVLTTDEVLQLSASKAAE